MLDKHLEAIESLRAALHFIPERSGMEVKTKAALLRFLEMNTSMELRDCGAGFYAAHRENEPVKPGIALRADYDAIALPGGKAAHLCGHDGHAAALCGLALLLEKATVQRNVFLIFQPAEETGAGAEGCLSIFKREEIGEIYGLHNLPGFPLGQVLTRPGAFACASEGLVLRFIGKAAHAAYPENGISPAMTIGKLLCLLPELAAPSDYQGMVLCTVIGVRMGEKAFGEAANHGEVWLTLRGERDEELFRVKNRILDHALRLSRIDALAFDYSEQDVFPATENNAECAEKVLRVCGGVPLKTAMRWSEDFGHYLHNCPGAFFGVGAGEDHPPLHTKDYEYPDALLKPTIEAFWKLVNA